MTKAIKKQAEKQYELGSDMNQKVVAKYFNPAGKGTWYLMNTEPNSDYAWGIVDLFAVEMGSFRISELESINLPFGLGIERDLMFEPIKAKDVWDKLNRGERV
tara:strand:- start:204 stop:512 length:309 start_codon:yes stop_codon:yes gene_type:complete